jgi:hypothetical protein
VFAQSIGRRKVSLGEGRGLVRRFEGDADSQQGSYENWELQFLHGATMHVT